MGIIRGTGNASILITKYDSYEHMLYMQPKHENIVADIIADDCYLVFELKENYVDEKES